MKKNIRLFMIISLLSLAAINTPVFGAPLDLSSWSTKNWDLPSGGHPASQWDLLSGNTAVKQKINADPSAYLNNKNQTNYTMQGSWLVDTTNDDDLMGFVFGYQDSSHFYMLDWKQNSQFFSGSTANEGLSVKKISSAQESNLTWTDFWSSSDSDNKTVLASNYGPDEGWKDNTSYDFFLDFRPGVFKIKVLEDSTTLWETTINDNSFASGQFGFYNFSQDNVIYNGFTETIIDDPTVPDIPPPPSSVPEPATMILLASGLIGLAGFHRKLNAYN